VGFDALGFLVVNGSKGKVAFRGAKRRFGLLELDIPAPEFNRIGLGAVGPQQISVMSMLCPSRAFAAFHDLKTGGASLPIAAYPHIEEFFGGRVTPRPRKMCWSRRKAGTQIPLQTSFDIAPADGCKADLR
jgi:hypothetical protein